MPHEFRSRTRRAIVGGALVGILVPLYLAWLLARQSKQAGDAYNWVEHTHEVLETLGGLQSAVREGESEQRAYLLTHGEQFAARFREARRKAPEVMEKIERMVRDNPQQDRTAAQLRAQLQSRLALLESNTALVSSTNREEINARLEAGAKETTELERLISLMVNEENRLLDHRRADYINLKRSLQHSAAATTGLGALLMAGIGYVLVRETGRRMTYERRIAEARDAALDAVSATSAFVAAVSHEIRTPMNGVLGTADLLLRDSSLTPKQRSRLETISSSGRSLLSLMNDILDLSKVQAGQMTFVKEDFSPVEVIEEVVTLFAPAAAKKGIELTHHLATDVPSQVKGDRLRLRQVLANLVSNAVKFTEKGGVIIHIVRRPLVEQEGQVCLRFEVRDTGPGISTEAQRQLFKPFSQVDAKLALRHGGTGLGLAISKELVQRMNGTLDVESTVGKGAAFWFTAIFGVVENAETEAITTLQGKKVIIVESRPFTAEAVRKHVEAWGMVPLMFTSPDEIPVQPLQVWESGTDRIAVVMGVAQGESVEDAVNAIRSRQWLGKTPLSLIWDGEASLEENSQPENAALLHYPFRPSELYDWLSGSTAKTEPLTGPSRSELPHSTIIVADDNPVNQQVITNQLEYFGMRTVLCANGLEAVARVQDGQGELVLMDCQMPDMDGFEATRVIRAWEEEEKRPRIPIIAVTANVMAGDAEHCLLSGMDGYLAKPINLNELQQALERWLPSASKLAVPEQKASSSNSDQVVDSVLDEAQMTACLTGEPSLDQNLVAMAVKQAVEQIDLMETATDESSTEVWTRSAHRGRGSSAVMGFVEVASVFQEAEFEARSTAAREVCIGKLRVSVERLQNRLKEAGFDASPVNVPSHPAR